MDLTFTHAEYISELWFHDVAGAGVGGIVGSIGSIQNYKHEREGLLSEVCRARIMIWNAVGSCYDMG